MGRNRHFISTSPKAQALFESNPFRQRQPGQMRQVRSYFPSPNNSISNNRRKPSPNNSFSNNRRKPSPNYSFSNNKRKFSPARPKLASIIKPNNFVVPVKPNRWNKKSVKFSQ